MVSETNPWMESSEFGRTKTKHLGKSSKSAAPSAPVLRRRPAPPYFVSNLEHLGTASPHPFGPTLSPGNLSFHRKGRGHGHDSQQACGPYDRRLRGRWRQHLPGIGFRAIGSDFVVQTPSEDRSARAAARFFLRTHVIGSTLCIGFKQMIAQGTFGIALGSERSQSISRDDRAIRWWLFGLGKSHLEEELAGKSARNPRKASGEKQALPRLTIWAFSRSNQSASGRSSPRIASRALGGGGAGS